MALSRWNQQTTRWWVVHDVILLCEPMSVQRTEMKPSPSFFFISADWIANIRETQTHFTVSLHSISPTQSSPNFFFQTKVAKNLVFTDGVDFPTKSEIGESKSAALSRRNRQTTRWWVVYDVILRCRPMSVQRTEMKPPPPFFFTSADWRANLRKTQTHFTVSLSDSFYDAVFGAPLSESH